MVSIENALNPDSIVWDSKENYILLNPRFPSKDLSGLAIVAREISERKSLQGHFWLATSGSTSQSTAQIKLVALSKQAFLASAASVNRHLCASSSDKWLQVLPRFHVGGLGIEARAFLCRGSVVTDFGKWDATRFCAVMKENGVTLTSMVPTQVFDVVRSQLRAPSSLRAVIVGGGPLADSLYLEARNLGWPLLPSYGMTETCSQIATATLESLLSASMPLAQKLDHVEWRTTEEGLLEVRGPSLLTLYGQRQDAGVIRDWDPKKNFWFASEDFAKLQGSCIQILGRKNDFIKIGGEASSLTRLRQVFERILNQFAASVAQQAVLIDAPSERLGSEIHLVTTIKNAKMFFSEILEKYNAEVLPFERVREVKYIPAIPRSDLGKVLWSQMKRELYGC